MTIDLDGVNKSYRTRAGFTPILKNVNLQVNAGEHVGILGQNGSGKSTLIRILSGSERPTSGTVRRGMSVSWPLAFGGAFLGSLTGLDNVRFVCRLYGVPYKEQMPFIEDFTELGKYLREPVRSYSSGMRARLAFAVSMAVDFDCYLIDEIVAVGDDRFQRKCQVELFEKRADKAMLIVSHSPDYVRDHCHKASVLVAGELTNFDDVEEAYRYYSSHEVAMQPHMQEESAPVAVHLPEEPAQIVTDGYHQTAGLNEYRAFLASLRIEEVPVFDSCDLVGQLNRRGETNAALQLAIWLAERRRKEPLFWITLGDLYADQRQHIPAVRSYLEALGLDPKSYWGNRNLATEFFNVGRYEDAIPVYEKALAVAPSADSKLELRLRWLDCHVLTDRVSSSNKADFGVSLKSLVAVDDSALSLADGRTSRLAVSGFVGSKIDSTRLKCVFRAGDRSLPGRPSFARNSIRRLASCSSSEAFAFVYYGPIGEEVAQIDYELIEDGETRLTGHVKVRRGSEDGGAGDDSFLDAARFANKHHKAEASALLYGTSAQRDAGIDIVAFAENLIAIGLYDEAEQRLTEWLRAHPSGHPERSYVLDLACLEVARSRVPGWRGTVDAMLRAEPDATERVSVLANLGHARVAENAIPEAIEYYEQASSLAAADPLIHFARGIHTVKLANEVPRLRADNLPPVGDGSGPQMVHLFACDGGYFQRFAAALVASSALRKGDVRVLIHAHIVDPDPETLELAERLKAELGLVFTTETSPATITEPMVRRAYLTCARFLVVPSLLRQYNCPVLITETDCLINWTWADIKSHAGEADVGYLHSSMWNWVPWTKIPAGIAYFAPSEAGVEHAEYVARFISEAFEREGSGAADLWTVDQVALWFAHVTRASGRSVHLPMSSVLTLATGDKSNVTEV